MKRILTAAFALLMIAAILVLSACASSAPTHPAATQTQPGVQKTFAPATTGAPAAPRPTMVPSTGQPPPAITVQPPMVTVVPGPQGQRPAPSTATAGAPGAGYYESNKTIGLSTGGAKDIQNFRENINNEYLPLPTDITYEGLFYDYYFDTGAAEPTDKLYSPSYSFAVTRDPFSEKPEYYLSVGLNSGMKESDFERKKLNLAIVLDNSGSMNENYSRYYYDNYGKNVDAYQDEGIDRKNKLRSAQECILAILDQLNDDDRFAIITFNSTAHLEKPMGYVDNADMRNVKNHVLDIDAGGSTNLDAGIQMATRQFNNLYESDNYEYENRIMVLTDAQPNTGDINSSNLYNDLRRNAQARIYTTFIGIGVDFNSSLIEEISKTRGANYYSVHSPREFRERVEEQFDYMVTPLIFNLELSFESRGWRIEKVFGSPEADEASGRLMKINTLFASKSDDSGAVKGGLVLLKLKKTSSDWEPVYLKTSYEDRDGRKDGDSKKIDFDSENPEYFDNSGIRKGILLVRYASLLKNWMIDERQHVNYNHPWDPSIREDTGIVIPDDYSGQWERQSLRLQVSGSYNRLFDEFADYFEDETDQIDDDSLNQELNIIEMLSKY